MTITTDGPEKKTAYQFVDTPARVFLSLYCDARAEAHPTEAILATIAQHDITDTIVRIRYHIEEAQVAQVDVHRIREALREALVIASIERTIDPIERQRRTALTRESSLQEAMERYIDQHEHLASIKDDLIQTALALEAEYDAKRRAEE